MTEVVTYEIDEDGVLGELSLSIDEYWSKVVNQIPSKYFNPNLRCEGSRLRLAREAMKRSSVRYLEVGVRRGHTLALVTLCAGDRLDYATGIDLWIEDYGGESNPGFEWVTRHLETLHDKAIVGSRINLVTGDSHKILPTLNSYLSRLFLFDGCAKNAHLFNLILVDGDHTPDGARQDLEDSFKLLESGGMLVFDDAVYNGDETLLRVWDEFVSDCSISNHCVTRTDTAWCWLVK